MEEILVENSTYNRARLRERLIENGIFERKCSSCGLLEWLGKPISLELEHKNGEKFDNRIENLCLLCPNCHAQTDTYRGKNRKKGRRTPKICPDCGASRTRFGLRCRSCAQKLNARKRGEAKIIGLPKTQTH